jgi:uncharacterized membrane protein
MALRVVAALLFVAAAPQALPTSKPGADALAIVRKHCVICHAAEPSHENFQKTPKNITLETVHNLKKYAATIYAQTIQTKAMALGNQTNMTDDERATLGRWLKALP